MKPRSKVLNNLCTPPPTPASTSASTSPSTSASTPPPTPPPGDDVGEREEDHGGEGSPDQEHGNGDDNTRQDEENVRDEEAVEEPERPSSDEHVFKKPVTSWKRKIVSKRKSTVGKGVGNKMKKVFFFF